MIPKIVHYCWFGNKEIPKKLKQNINSWKEENPDFKFICWNEKNFNLKSAPSFVKKAYETQNWAFVADYVRLYAVYNYGGVYLDTDVELIKKLDVVVKKFSNGYMGFENRHQINTGLGFSAEKNNIFLKEMMDKYEKIDFDLQNKEAAACPIINTEILVNNGLILNNKLQVIKGFYILPTEYLCPLELGTGKLRITPNTISIHWYNASWMKGMDKVKIKSIMKMKKILPGHLVSFSRKFFRMILKDK